MFQVFDIEDLRYRGVSHYLKNCLAKNYKTDRIFVKLRLLNFRILLYVLGLYKSIRKNKERLRRR